MITEILKKEIREKAGSDSYNRFEYQVHWIVHHMIDEYSRDEKKNYLVLCEFHDDMAKLNCPNNPEDIEFFQVKTTSRYKNWTINRVTTTTKKNNGIKNSFLGFIFINFINFYDECKSCHFVSNIGMDEEIRTWQSIIEDEKSLKETNKNLYDNLKEAIRNEIELELDIDFEKIFDKFVQNTFLYSSDLDLKNYETVVKGKFFEVLSTKDVSTTSSYKILADLINEVRKKSKYIIDTPISFKKLKEKKGISSDIIGRIDTLIDEGRNNKLYDELDKYLSSKNMDKLKRNIRIKLLRDHHLKMINIGDYRYIDSVKHVEDIIDNVIQDNLELVDDISKMIHIISNLSRENKDLIEFNTTMIEVLYYEKILRIY